MTLAKITMVGAVSVVAVSTLFTQPVSAGGFGRADIKQYDYKTSVVVAQQVIQNDMRDPQVKPECRPILKTQGRKTAKAVLMLHGVSACPEQFSELADYFYNQGYNVYVPRVPHHGQINLRDYAKLTRKEMTDVMNQGASIVSGLGDERGVVGLSGGGNMATWLSQFGSHIFSRTLLLAPFYQPSSKHMSAWQAPLLRNLYGRNILPDRWFGDMSYRVLGKYMLLVKKYRRNLDAPGLKHVAVVLSERDEEIDANLARSIPEKMAKNNHASFKLETIPASLGVGHDMVSPQVDGMPQAKGQLYAKYFQLYEAN